MLFDKGVVLSESFDARQIRYFYYRSSFDIFVLNNNSKLYSQMQFQADLMWQSTGFAVEIHARGPDFNEGDDLCKKTANEQLRSMITSCFGNVTLRMLTKEERSQIMEYQNEQRGKISLL